VENYHKEELIDYDYKVEGRKNEGHDATLSENKALATNNEQLKDELEKAQAACAAMTLKVRLLHAVAEEKKGTEVWGDWNWTNIEAETAALLKSNPGQPILNALTTQKAEIARLEHEQEKMCTCLRDLKAILDSTAE